MTVLFFFLASLLGVMLANLLIFRLLEQVRSWPQRRTLHCTVLALPLLSLGIGGSAWCFHNLTASWMTFASLVPVLLVVLIVVSALLLGGIRLALITRLFVRYHGKTDPHLHALALPLLQKLHLSPVRILRCSAHQPFALTWGFFRPTVLISSWMVEHLDAQELEAVVAHELHHILQQDCLMIWLTTMLRDAFFYLPTSRQAYRALQGEKELECDDLVVHITRRPLALASALTKVWVYVLEQGAPASLPGIQAFAGEESSLHARIERLCHRSEIGRDEFPTKAPVSSLFLFVQGIGFVFLLTFLSCGTMPFLPHLF